MNDSVFFTGTDAVSSCTDLLYLISIATMFGMGVLLGLAMKLELLAPGKTIMDAQTYNATFTVHGVIMIFVVVVPGLPAVFRNNFV